MACYFYGSLTHQTPPYRSPFPRGDRNLLVDGSWFLVSDEVRPCPWDNYRVSTTVTRGEIAPLVLTVNIIDGFAYLAFMPSDEVGSIAVTIFVTDDVPFLAGPLRRFPMQWTDYGDGDGDDVDSEEENRDVV